MVILGIAFSENLKVVSKQKVPSDWLLGLWQNKSGVKVTHRFWVGWACFDPIGFVEKTQKCEKKLKTIFVVILLINTRSAYTIHVHMINLGGKKTQVPNHKRKTCKYQNLVSYEPYFLSSKKLYKS